MKTKHIFFLALFPVLVLFFSCTKGFEEINKDPDGFTTASDGSLFNGIIGSLVLTGDEQMYLQNEILYKQTQQAALTSSAWGSATSIGIKSVWSNYYDALAEIRELEDRFSAKDPSTAGLNNMKAMLKVVLAYKTFKLTDYFGDIPFTEAGYGYQNLALLHPKYDTQREIYLFLLNELKWADENINPADVEEPFNTFKTFDKLFNGDLVKWKKFANSLRLRYAMRMSEKEAALAGEIIKDILDNHKMVLLGYDILAPVLESACLWPSSIGFKNQSVNWAFREQKNLRMGSNLWHQLSVNDSSDGSGIFDPRAYIFFETNNTNKWAPYPQIPDGNTLPSGGIPYGEHRDQVGSFGLKGEECIYSPFNYFLIRDEDNVPVILMTGAEVHFLKAEAYERGIGVVVNKSTAEIEYMNGINASVEWWKMVADNSKLPLSGMKFPEMIHIPANIDVSTVLNHFGLWNATTDDERLKFIYTQRWLDAFRQPSEAYAEARRIKLLPREGDAINHFRFPYPQSEAMYNTKNYTDAVQRQGGESPDVKIWWIPN
ncbi:MAG: SusD/RagB family nutrient-binding outer membrane lipoprotein [Bacteroidetes bacterium]|nr:SusD/RagB family nutrient-binding outer membrane lipoprotein [Bacteroidota bacterium]